MAKNKYCVSASKLYVELVGDEEDTAFALAEAPLDPVGLTDLYDLMWDEESLSDSEDDSYTKKSASPIVSISQLLAARQVSPNECSICYCEFDDVVSVLECGHRFCQACVEQYLLLTISEAPPLIHKRSFVRRDGIAISVTQRDLIGVKCPHFSCLGVIEEEKIRDLVDAKTYGKFDQFALDQTLVKMMIKKELRPCPFSCGYFVQEDCLCVNIDCRKKQKFLREKERKKLERLVAQADERLEGWATTNPDLVKLCPLCSTHIEKNGGCDHMYCTRCKQPFLWSKALPFKSDSHWLAKAKAELQRRRENPPLGVMFPETPMPSVLTSPSIAH